MRTWNPSPNFITVSDLKINISRLSDGTHEYDLETSPSELELDDRFDGKIRVQASIKKSGSQLFLATEIQSSRPFECDRCLESFEKVVEAEYSVLYTMESSGSDSPGSNGEVEENVFISPDTNIIDLGEDVRQYLLLSFPIKSLCREDCKGLCSSCGTNLNRKHCACQKESIDPRWEALKNFSGN